MWKCRDYILYLLDLGGGAFEELDVSVADALAVLGQRLVGTFVAGEQNKRVSGGAPISLVNEQYTILTIQHVDRRQTLLEELQLDNESHKTGLPENQEWSRVYVGIELNSAATESHNVQEHSKPE